MKYKLISKHQEVITIDEDVKEDFKDIMHWDEKEFNAHTTIVEEDEKDE